MIEIPNPLYAIEYYGTYADALWLYRDGGVDECFYSDNDGKEIARFAYEQDAREYFKKHKCDRMMFWDPADYDPTKPDLGIGYYELVKYKWCLDNIGEVLEKSKGGLTRRQMENLFKKSGVSLKELEKQLKRQSGEV